MGKFRGFLLLLFFFLSSVLCFGRSSEKALPAPHIETSSLPTAEDSITAMYVSHSYPENNPKVFPGSNLIDVEAKAIFDFIGFDAKEKTIYVTRYELGSDKVVNALIEAKKKGVQKIIIITDLNESLNGIFKEGETRHSRFQDAEFKANANATSIQKLLEAGFKYNDPKYGIFSLPLYNEKDDPNLRVPLMHEKEVTLTAKVNNKDIYFVFDGTANLTERPRMNRTLESNDPQVGQYMAEHSRLLQGTYAQGLETKDVESMVPLRILYKDGSWQERAFTDGKYNLNRRIIQYVHENILEKHKTEPDKNKIIAKYSSHFVDTIVAEQDADFDAKKIFPEMTRFGVHDNKFIYPYGWGIIAASVAYPVFRPGGAPEVLPHSEASTKNDTFYVYQRNNDGEEDDPEGPPLNAHVWHDKTTVYQVLEDGVEWCYIFTGSFNHSQNFANAEHQTAYKVPAQSAFCQSMIKSIKLVAENEKEYAIPLRDGIFREFLRRLLGQGFKVVSVEAVQKVDSFLKKFQYDDLQTYLIELAKQGRPLPTRKSTEEVEKNVTRFVNVLKWFREETANEKVYIGFKRALLFGIVHASPLSAYEKKFAIEHALWRPGITKSDLTAELKKAWKILEIPEDLPSPTKKLKAKEIVERGKIKLQVTPKIKKVIRNTEFAVCELGLLPKSYGFTRDF